MWPTGLRGPSSLGRAPELATYLCLTASIPSPALPAGRRKSMPTTRSSPNLNTLRCSWLREAIEAYLSWLEQQGYSASSIGHRVQPLVRFANLALLHGATRLAQLPDLVDTFVDAEVDLHRQRVTSAERLRLYPVELRQPIVHFLRVASRTAGVAPQPYEPTFWGQAEGFFAALRDERGLRAATIRLYRGHLRAFEVFLEANGVCDLAALNATHIDRFIRATRTRLCAGAMPGVCGVLRLLLRWLFREQWVPRDLSDSVEAPQAYRLATLPRSITWDEVLSCSTGNLTLPSAAIELRHPRRVHVHQAPQILHGRAEGGHASPAFRRESPHLADLPGERPSAESFPLLAETGIRELGEHLAAAHERPREGFGERERDAEAEPHQEGRGHRLGHRGARQAKKNTWGALNGRWVPPDLRDEVVDFVSLWSARTGLAADRLIDGIGIQRGKFYDWKTRYGKVNEHNARIPRDSWLTDAEKEAIIKYHDLHPLDGYRRLTYMMIDEDVVAASPTSIYRVLHNAGLLDRWNKGLSRKGAGFVQPLQPHEHWHTDFSYINVQGTFFYLCSVLDGCSRFVAGWDLLETMTERDVEIVIERARESFPGVNPRIISDNGGQFIAHDFREYIRLTGMTHVRTSRNYPQANGKLERWHETLKGDAVRIRPPSSLAEGRRLIESFVDKYNNHRLHSAIGYVTPADRLAGRQEAIWADRDRKLEAARELRARARQAARQPLYPAAVAAGAGAPLA
jgi:putative transposase